MTNPIGVISMFYARPFGPEHLGLLVRIRAAGLQFIELLTPEPGELDAATTRQALRDNGLQVIFAARLNASRDPSSSDEAARRAGIDYLKRCADICVEFGGTLVGGPLFGSPLVFAGRAPAPVPEDLRRDRVAWTVEALRSAGEHAAKLGVTFAVEPLNRFETDVLNTTRQGIELIDQVGLANVGLMLDTFHMNMEDDDIAVAIRAAGQRVVHFQANENHRGFIGRGHLDWRSIARALADITYTGPITLEPFRRDDHRIGVPLAQWRAPTKDETVELSRSIDYLRAHLTQARAR
jgi:D-psicose/D-tagatose/L-ribulose 3-epimerase